MTLERMKREGIFFVCANTIKFFFYNTNLVEFNTVDQQM